MKSIKSNKQATFQEVPHLIGKIDLLEANTTRAQRATVKFSDRRKLAGLPLGNDPCQSPLWINRLVVLCARS